MKGLNLYRIFAILCGITLVMGLGVNSIQFFMSQDHDQTSIGYSAEDLEDNGREDTESDPVDGEGEDDTSAKEKTLDSIIDLNQGRFIFRQNSKTAALKLSAAVLAVKSVLIEIVAPPPEM